jgi:two-component system sensor histidine kinase/response regulator
MEDRPTLEAAALERLREWGGDKLVQQMVKLYIENAHVRLEQIDAGLGGGGSLRDAEMAAHSLKSSAANVGARRVSAISAEMEDAAEREAVDELRTMRDALAAAISEAETAIRAHVPEAES